jgi:hypothetical protein
MRLTSLGQARVSQAAEGIRIGRSAGRLGSPGRHVSIRVYRSIRRSRIRAACVQKKSKGGIATPKADIELIKQRLKQAVEISRTKE